MDCFGLDEWVGFVRKVVLPERMAEMQRHLDEGCARCSRTEQMWRGVLDLGGREASYEPPEGAVRLVKEYYAQQSFLRSARGRREQGELGGPARLIFDSFRQPLPAGARASGFHARQLLFSAGETLIHIRVEGQLKRVTLAGQLQDSSKPSNTLSNVPVTLVGKRRAVAQTMTDSLGEFKFQCEAGKDFELAIGLDGERSLVVPLKDLLALRGTGPSGRRRSVSLDRGSSSRKPSAARGSLREH